MQSINLFLALTCRRNNPIVADDSQLAGEQAKRAYPVYLKISNNTNHARIDKFASSNFQDPSILNNRRSSRETYVNGSVADILN